MGLDLKILETWVNKYLGGSCLFKSYRFFFVPGSRDSSPLEETIPLSLGEDASPCQCVNNRC